jgi:hypothetical protein
MAGDSFKKLSKHTSQRGMTGMGKGQKSWPVKSCEDNQRVWDIQNQLCQDSSPSPLNPVRAADLQATTDSINFKYLWDV